MEECSVSDIGAESFSLLSRRCRTRQYQTEPALMAARSPNELIMERKAPTRTKEMTFFSLLNIRQWEGIDYRSVEEKFTSTLQKGPSAELSTPSEIADNAPFCKYIDFERNLKLSI